MAKFRVYVSQEVSTTVVVEAESQEDAEDRAIEAMTNGEIQDLTLDCGDPTASVESEVGDDEEADFTVKSEDEGEEE